MASYASASDVAARTPMLLAGSSNFSASSEPTLTEVNTFIQEITSDMHTAFHAVGYSGSADSTDTLFDTLRMCNALGAAAMAEITRITDTIDARERSRGQVLWGMYEKMRDRLANMDLSQSGFGIDNVEPYFGGTSVSDKELDETDSDVVQPRFFRNQFRWGSAATTASGTRNY